MDNQFKEHSEVITSYPAIFYIYKIHEKGVLYDMVLIKNKNDYHELDHNWKYLCNSIIKEVKSARISKYNIVKKIKDALVKQ